MFVVEVPVGSVTDRAGADKLARWAAQHEVVLVGSHHLAANGDVPAMRTALLPRRMVALLVDGEVPRHEQRLINDLLNEGWVPLILTGHDPPPAELTGWLDADNRLVLSEDECLTGLQSQSGEGIG